MILNVLLAEHLIADLLNLTQPGSSPTAVLIIRMAQLQFVSADHLTNKDVEILRIRSCLPHCSLTPSQWRTAGIALANHVEEVGGLFQLPIILRDKYQELSHVP